MKKICVVNGSGGVGKDTFVSYSTEYLSNFNLKCSNISSVDKIKSYGARLGWNGKKDSKGREFLSDLKELSARYDGPIKYVQEKIESSSCDVFFVMIREGIEIDKLKVIYPDLSTILVVRDGLEKFNNKSDSCVYDYVYDYIVENNGNFDELKESAELIINEILKENKMC